MRDTSDENPERRDIVDRAIDALRAQTILDGPPPRLSARTVQMLRTAESRQSWLRTLCIAAILLICLPSLGLILTLEVKEIRTQAMHRDEPVPAPALDRNRPEFVNTGEDHRTLEPTFEPRPDVTPVVATLGSAVSVTGHVYFHGDVPSQYRRTKSDDGSMAEHDQVHDESVVIDDDSTLENVVVSISAGLKSGEPFPVPGDAVVLNQKNCMFEPHVVAAMTGQEVIVRNLDPMLHSVHSMDAEETPAFNFPQPADARRVLSPFQTVKTFKVKCDIHPWMTAWVRVFNHPYFDVTHEDGAFSIKDLPAGTYTVKAWHEVFGVQEKQITVTGGEPVVLDFTFEPRQ